MISSRMSNARHGRASLAAVGGVLTLALSTVVAMPAAAQDAEALTLTTATSDAGTYLVGPTGNTLYFFTRDVAAGRSNCAGGCLEAWPPLLLADGQAIEAGEGIDGVLGSAPLGDAGSIVTYDGRPLYYFAQDAAAGETKGQGLGDVWFVALTNGTAPANQPAISLKAATSDDLGTFLTGRDDLTLYYFTKDETPGVSACSADCLAKWPPLTVPWGNFAAAGEGVLGVVGVAPRDDGTWQVTYDGRPLYYFADDEVAGDTKGQDLGDVWYVALTDGTVPEEDE